MSREEYLNQPRLDPQKGEIPLPNGHTLFWKMDESVGCRTYISDEVGGGVTVWCTALVDSATLLAAIVHEAALNMAERERQRQPKVLKAYLRPPSPPADERTTKMISEWESGKPETPCGRGSQLASTEVIRAWLPIIVREKNLRTVADLGAGDCNWIQHVEWDVDYSAYDIRPRRSFVKKLNVIVDSLPKVGLLLCVFVLNHLPISERQKGWANIVSSGSRFVVLSYMEHHDWLLFGEPDESVLLKDTGRHVWRYGLWRLG